MVDFFAEKMKRRLREKSRNGWSGWDEDWFHEGEITERIKGQATRDSIDPVDIANYCAFLDLKREWAKKPK